MKYLFQEIEKKWQNHWQSKKTFKTENKSELPKYYVLDMFPYPSGAGLHVGHPLGYIASDIYSRYKRLKGFNVLHPMGFDSFGLPAEQYAIQTGQHPAHTTEKNLERYRQQLKSMGFSFDWDREVQTSSPNYYKWTQWIFIQLFNSWYDEKENRARPIDDLIALFQKEGNINVLATSSNEGEFSFEDWNSFDEKKKSDILLEYRLTYLADTVVNWCPELGTVLANDEVKDGLSERGGHPVVQKQMRQWMMRITAYADRLLNGLDRLDWSDSVKEMQRNWIGRSEGASVIFDIEAHDEKIDVFTTRPDTLFGVSFMVLAPEHEYVKKITTKAQLEKVDNYVEKAALKSERERMSEVKIVSGVFTGAYAIHPFSGKKLPIWVADYVLSGYGSGAVMAVPSGDQRDWNFAKKFELEIPNVIAGSDLSEGANEDKSGVLTNSSFLDGMKVDEAISTIITELEKKKIGEGRVQYKLRDAVFSRQRYWGEPIPVYFDKDIPHIMDESSLPLELPEVDKYLPTEAGEPPLARAKNWKTDDGFEIEANTMPGWAGSSWYMFRYMDPENTSDLFSQEAVNYWQNVDFYFGGAEHATGHLLYARFWTKFLYDIGKVPQDEPFKKMLNQGMITYFSASLMASKGEKIALDAHDIESNKEGIKNLGYDLKKFRSYLLPISLVKGKFDHASKDGNKIKISDLKNELAEYKDYRFFNSKRELRDDDDIVIAISMDKMSKSKFNVVNPDDLIERYGADTLRCYEMFLGPVEQHKPWEGKGIEGVHKFLRKFWSLFHDEDNFKVIEGSASENAHKALNKFLKKVNDDLTRLSFNTVVSECMILTNKLIELNCHEKEILEPFVIAISPYAPHIAEELWEKLGHVDSVAYADFPNVDEKYLVESSVKYPISFNGKVRFLIELPADLSKDEIESKVISNENTIKWLEDKTPKKVIVVPNKIVNIVV